MAKSGSEMLTTIVLNGKTSPSLAKAFKQSEKLADKTYKKIQGYGKTLKKASIAAGAAVISGAGYALKAAVDYETSLAKVSTIADTSKKSMSELSQEVLSVSNKTGVAAGQINESLYEAISAGADTAKATGLVEVAVKAAKGGFTDTATAVDGLTSVLNTYGMKTEDAGKLANQFLITQNKGKTTFGELAGSIGKIAPIAQSAGIKTDEMLSSLAALTANGIQTSEAVSGTKAAISNIIKPTAEAQKMASMLGVEFSAGALQSKGFSGFLAELKQKTGGNLEIMSKLFGSVEGLNTVLTLTSDSGMTLMGDTMKEMQTNTTALDDAYNKMTGTPAERIARMTNKLQNMAISIGEKLLPTAEKLMSKLEEVDFDKVLDRISSSIQWLIDNAPFLVAGFATIKTAMLTWEAVGVIAGLVTAFKNWRMATEGMSIAQATLNLIMSANPVGLVITAVAALVAGFIVLWNTCDGFRNFFINMWEGIKDIAGKIGDWFKGIFGGGNDSKTVTLDAKTTEAQSKAQSKAAKIPKHGTGGTFNVPHVAVVGDAPETIVPHGNTPRNRALLSEAAAGVGIGGGVNITFAPVINGGNGPEVRKAISESEDEFERRMDKYFARRRRLGYGV